MKKNILIALAALIILGAVIGAYLFWQGNHPQPATVQANNSPPPVSAPVSASNQVVATPPPQPPLPQLADSDSFVFDALAGLLGNQTLLKIFHSEKVIHNMVVTIDNLTKQRVSVSVMPFDPPSGRFLTAGTEGHLTISPQNANRYDIYVNIAQVLDAKSLVKLYARLYPLFQQAYGELGYPNKNFNDQLIETLDDLLDTPEIKEPIKLVQPKFYFQYADPEIEALSIGQKIMLRLGRQNAKLVKIKLKEIKQELALHVNELHPRKAN